MSTSANTKTYAFPSNMKTLTTIYTCVVDKRDDRGN